MKLELEKGLELFFSKQIEMKYHSFSFYVFVRCSFTYDVEKTFVAL